jgi:hypothetical protein
VAAVAGGGRSVVVAFAGFQGSGDRKARQKWYEVIMHVEDAP